MWLCFKTVLTCSQSSPPVFVPQSRNSLSAAFQYIAWTRRIQSVLSSHSLSGLCTLGTLSSNSKPEKNAVTFQLQRNPHRSVSDHWFQVAPKWLLSRRWSQRTEKICERLQERRQWRSHTYQLYKGKSTITVSNKKHVLCSWLGNKMVPNINCMFFRRSIILQKEITFATITF